MTMRAIRCGRCTRPTGGFYDPDAGIPELTLCPGCHAADVAGPIPEIDDEAQEEEEELSAWTCDLCGSMTVTTGLRLIVVSAQRREPHFGPVIRTRHMRGTYQVDFARCGGCGDRVDPATIMIGGGSLTTNPLNFASQWEDGERG